MLKHNVPLCSCGFFFLLENGMWSIPSNTTSPCHLPNSDCTLHVKTLAVWRGVFGWSPELWEVTLWLSVYVQNVNNLRAEQLSACTRFLFFLFSFKEWNSSGSRAAGCARSGWLRVKGRLSAGHISWMFWEAVMETGEVRQPIPSSGVLAVSEQKTEEGELATVQNVFSLVWFWPKWKQVQPHFFSCR